MFLFCCLLIGAAIAGLILVPRYLRHSALQRLGWFWNDKPDLSITAGLNLPPFGIDQNGVITAHDPEWPLERVEMTLFLLHAFFGRIRDFVWRELGIWPRPVLEIDALPPGR